MTASTSRSPTHYTVYLIIHYLEVSHDVVREIHLGVKYNLQTGEVNDSRLGPVLVILWLPSLHLLNASELDYGGTLLLPHHPPEVIHGGR